MNENQSFTRRFELSAVICFCCENKYVAKVKIIINWKRLSLNIKMVGFPS
jgi:hypothetical protein